MDDFLGISYRLSHSENFENFLKAVQVGVVTRKICLASMPTIKLTMDEGKYTLHTIGPFRHLELTFKLEEEIDEETFDGRIVKTILTVEDNKLIQVQKGEFLVTITREFFGDHMEATFVVGNVVARRTYDRLR